MTMTIRSLVGSPVCMAAMAMAALCAPAVQAQTVDVKDAWARATVPGQKATGAFMTLTAKDALRLTAVASPVAGVAEIHEMKMDGDVMKMRAVAGGLPLPAGQAVVLRPGGYHLMLMDLKSALAKDSKVPVTLTFKDSTGAETKLELSVPVATVAPATAPGKPSAAKDPAMHKH